MSAFEETQMTGNHGRAAVLEEDRRTNSRAKFLKHIRIRHVDSSQADEVGTMIDLSRDGLYFTAKSSHYEAGMQLRVTLPGSGSECTCEVVRIERLKNGRLGIGVRILGW